MQRPLLILLLLVGQTVFSKPVMLEEYLGEVRSANPGIQSAKKQADAQENRIRPSSTLDDPFFAVGPEQIPFNGSGDAMIRYQLSQSIPFPGKLGAKGDAAEKRFLAAKASQETAERETVVLATQAFYRAYFNQRARELNESLKGLLTSTMESAKARYRTGDPSHHDWLLARVELGVLGVERLRLEREGKALLALLNEFRNVLPETPLEIAPIAFEASSQAPEPDIVSQPELRAAEASVLSAEAERKSARLSYFPDLVIQGMAMQSTMGPMGGGAPSSWGIMVGINLPIFFWRKQMDLSAAAESTSKAALLEKKSLENRLRTETTDAKEQLKTARDVVSLFETDVIPATQIAAENARSGYAARRIPLSQYLETLRAKRTQELELLAARIDVKLAETRLRELLSSPPTLRLAPSRPTLFGGGTMGTGMGASDTVSMGRGMSGPSRKSGAPGGAQTPLGGNAPGMGGM